MYQNVRIVLIGTSHAGNIGSVARAMKVMGFTDLCLVEPQVLPDGKSHALASGAVDVLDSARVFDTLDEAVADCGLVIGTSARSRTLQWPMLDAREAGEKLAQESQDHPVAIVFGRERTGLSNDELQKCHFHVAIPANPEYSSLNLAMAVQIICYEARMGILGLEQQQAPEEDALEYPSAGDMERFYVHLEDSLLDTGFIVKQHPGQVMNKLRRLYNRARPEVAELNILRGILSSIQRTAAGKTRRN